MRKGKKKEKIVGDTSLWAILGLWWVGDTGGGSGWCLTGHRYPARSRVTVYKQLLRSNKLALELHPMCVSLVSQCWMGCRCWGTGAVLLTGQDCMEVGDKEKKKR